MVKPEILICSAKLGMPVTAISMKGSEEKSDEKVLVTTEVHEDKSLPKKSICKILYIYTLFVLSAFFLTISFSQLSQSYTHSLSASLASTPFVDNVYISFASTNNTKELAKIVFAAQHWRNLGVRSALTLVGEERGFRKGANRLLINTLDILQAEIVYVNTNSMDLHSLAQLMSFYVSSTDLASVFDDDTIIITAKTDYIPLDLPNHLPQIDKGIDVKLYDNYCCDIIDLGAVQYHKYSMNTIAMTTKRWMEVFDVKRGLPTEELVKQIEKDFGDFILFGSESQDYYVQELAFGLKFDQWKRREIDSAYITSTFDHKQINRFDASKFLDSPAILKSIPLTTYNDVIVADEYLEDSEWRLTAHLLKRAFSAAQMKYYVELRERVKSFEVEEQKKEWMLWMQMYMNVPY